MAAIVSESVFDVHTRLMLMHAIATSGLYEHRTVTETAGGKKKKILPRRGVEPGSVLHLAFLSDAQIPTDTDVGKACIYYVLHLECVTVRCSPLAELRKKPALQIVWTHGTQN